MVKSYSLHSLYTFTCKQEWMVTGIAGLNLILISSCMQICFAIPKYLNFTVFSKLQYTSLYVMTFSALCSWYMSIYLVSAVFFSRPTPVFSIIMPSMCMDYMLVYCQFLFSYRLFCPWTWHCLQEVFWIWCLHLPGV